MWPVGIGGFLNANTDRSQHALGMIARLVLFDNANVRASHQTSEQQCALDLRRRVWCVIHDLSCDPLLDPDGQTSYFTKLREACAHLRQRRCDPTHWTAAERRITIQRGPQSGSCNDAHHQSRRRAAVAAIQRMSGLTQPAEFLALNGQLTGVQFGNVAAELVQHVCSGPAVIAGQRLAHAARADRQRAHDQCAMRDRLVAGDCDLDHGAASRNGISSCRPSYATNVSAK